MKRTVALQLQVVVEAPAGHAELAVAQVALAVAHVTNAARSDDGIVRFTIGDAELLPPPFRPFGPREDR